MYKHTNEFDHVLYCRRMSKYYQEMSNFYENPEECKFPEITYTSLCEDDHEYYNNGYGERCILCGYMKIVDSNIILPNEILAKIIYANSTLYGLLISKSIMNESVKYAADLVYKIIAPREEIMNKLGLCETLTIERWLTENRIDILIRKCNEKIYDYSFVYLMVIIL